MANKYSIFFEGVPYVPVAEYSACSFCNASNLHDYSTRKVLDIQKMLLEILMLCLPHVINGLGQILNDMYLGDFVRKGGKCNPLIPRLLSTRKSSPKLFWAKTGTFEQTHTVLVPILFYRNFVCNSIKRIKYTK